MRSVILISGCVSFNGRMDKEIVENVIKGYNIECILLVNFKLLYGIIFLILLKVLFIRKMLTYNLENKISAMEAYKYE